MIHDRANCLFTDKFAVLFCGMSEMREFQEPTAYLHRVNMFEWLHLRYEGRHESGRVLADRLALSLVPTARSPAQWQRHIMLLFLPNYKPLYMHLGVRRQPKHVTASCSSNS